ncbi:MAG: SpoIIE family protein phosphatase [Planctomycetota bacterium]|jgi:PAS domain S-box-containing protein
MDDVSTAVPRVEPGHDLRGRPSDEELRRLFDLSLQMLCIAGVDGYFKCINPAFERTLGYTRDELLSRTFLEFVHPDDRAATLNELDRLAEGMPTVHFENRYRCKDGSYRWLAWTSTPKGANGLIYAAALDVTDHKRAELEIDTNLRMQRAVGSLLRVCLEPVSLEEQLQRSLEALLSIPWIALESRGAIFLVEDDPELLALKAHVGLPAELLATCREVPLGECLCGRAGASQRIVFADSDDARHERRCSAIPPHGHYCVPVISDRELYGVLNLYVSRGHTRNPEEERLLSSVADVLAGAVKRDRMEAVLKARETELVAAQRIQEHLLPDSPPSVPGFDVWGACYPAEFAAGDIFDYLPMPNGTVGFVIGDVSGHGFGPALLMASTCARLRSLAESMTPVDAILARVNTALAKETAEGRFVTLLLGVLDPQRRALVFTNAGHPAGMVLDRFGNVKAELESTALPLGILTQTAFPAAGPVVLQPGDTVVMLTDGVLEAMSSEDVFFGSSRALEIVRANLDKPAREIVERLHRAVCHFSRGETLQDDVTLLVIKVAADEGRPGQA